MKKLVVYREQVVGVDVQIAVVIPTYNRAHLIGRAIESVLEQSISAVEIIVVDDGSTDNTKAVVSAFGDAVTYIFQENAGSAVARHTGMERSFCHWVALLDSDDIWFEDHLERLTAVIQKTSGQARFYFANTIQPDKESFWGRRDFTIVGEYELKRDATEWVMKRRQPMLLQSTIFNRAAYFESGGFLAPLRFRDDTHLFLKLGLGGAACAVAGYSTQMTADDDPENRLTLTHDKHNARGNVMQVIMFRDLLQRFSALGGDTRRELTRRLAAAHLGLAKHAMRERRIGTAVWQLMQSLFVDPRVILTRTVRKQ